ncbi:hypothetical protein DFH07DRAFT_814127 [Mycena maculata]|uniref:Uncharacterized protein n=1 Tax=Mycena maculata TaxID=230809 RepID=A0AAD7JD62_9AGAR|nr:hypothetical protein DFH07DRAFT_814127 [Mycena maculata]
MDARLRGTLLTSAGFLFALIGFTLSVLSTLLRLLLPYHPTGANVQSPTSRRSTIRRTPETNPGRRKDVPSITDSSISSRESTSSFQESCSVHLTHSSTSEVNVPRPRKLEPPSRNGAHGRVASEYMDRPDFRNTVTHRRRRSESTPPSPSPWAFSHPEPSNPSARSPPDASRRSGSVSSSSCRLPRASSFESVPFVDVPAIKTKLSFLHLRKVRKAPSASNVIAARQPSPPSHPTHSLEKAKSQLFAPRRRRSQHIIEADAVRRHSIALASPTEEEEACCPEGRDSQETVHECRPVPKRSQTPRTHPYEAPYFFPAPGSVAAENYLPPRRKPIRSRTLPTDGHPSRSRSPSPPVPPLPASVGVIDER